ncbi:MAG: hypothetical protein M3R61_09875 [Chloroflexota bacterium]|nr:hypothetical protein [Chloroflexota bacterium]
MAPLSAEEVAEQQRLLATYRRTLGIYLQQQAEISRAYSPPSILNGISEARSQIRRIKIILRDNNVDITDDPDDEDIFVESRPVRLRQQPSDSSKIWVFGIFAGAAIAGLIIVTLGLFFFPTIFSRSTVSTPIPSIISATSLPLSIATIESTPIPAAPSPTGTAIIPTQTQDQALQETVTASLQSSPVYGPENGSLKHNIENDNMEFSSTGVAVRDFIAEMRFRNPYDRNIRPWDYGFLFRDKDNQQYRLYVDSDGKWIFQLATVVDGKSYISSRGDGDVQNLNTSTGGSNLLRLVVINGTASLLVNGNSIASVDISDRMVAGDVFVATGLANNDEVSDGSTDYENLTIWQIK